MNNALQNPLALMNQNQNQTGGMVVQQTSFQAVWVSGGMQSMFVSTGGRPNLPLPMASTVGYQGNPMMGDPSMAGLWGGMNGMENSLLSNYPCVDPYFCGDPNMGGGGNNPYLNGGFGFQPGGGGFFPFMGGNMPFGGFPFGGLQQAQNPQMTMIYMAMGLFMAYAQQQLGTNNNGNSYNGSRGNRGEGRNGNSGGISSDAEAVRVLGQLLDYVRQQNEGRGPDGSVTPSGRRRRPRGTNGSGSTPGTVGTPGTGTVNPPAGVTTTLPSGDVSAARGVVESLGAGLRTVQTSLSDASSKIAQTSSSIAQARRELAEVRDPNTRAAIEAVIRQAEQAKTEAQASYDQASQQYQTLQAQYQDAQRLLDEALRTNDASKLAQAKTKAQGAKDQLDNSANQIIQAAVKAQQGNNFATDALRQINAARQGNPTTATPPTTQPPSTTPVVYQEADATAATELNDGLKEEIENIKGGLEANDDYVRMGRETIGQIRTRIGQVRDQATKARLEQALARAEQKLAEGERANQAAKQRLAELQRRQAEAERELNQAKTERNGDKLRQAKQKLDALSTDVETASADNGYVMDASRKVSDGYNDINPVSRDTETAITAQGGAPNAPPTGGANAMTQQEVQGYQETLQQADTAINAGKADVLAASASLSQTRSQLASIRTKLARVQNQQVRTDLEARARQVEDRLAEDQRNYEAAVRKQAETEQKRRELQEAFERAKRDKSEANMQAFGDKFTALGTVASDFITAAAQAKQGSGAMSAAARTVEQAVDQALTAQGTPPTQPNPTTPPVTQPNPVTPPAQPVDDSRLDQGQVNAKAVELNRLMSNPASTTAQMNQFFDGLGWSDKEKVLKQWKFNLDSQNRNRVDKGDGHYEDELWEQLQNKFGDRSHDVWLNHYAKDPTGRNQDFQVAYDYLFDRQNRTRETLSDGEMQALNNFMARVRTEGRYPAFEQYVRGRRPQGDDMSLNQLWTVQQGNFATRTQRRREEMLGRANELKRLLDTGDASQIAQVLDQIRPEDMALLREQFFQSAGRQTLEDYVKNHLNDNTGEGGMNRAQVLLKVFKDDMGKQSELVHEWLNRGRAEGIEIGNPGNGTSLGEGLAVDQYLRQLKRDGKLADFQAIYDSKFGGPGSLHTQLDRDDYKLYYKRERRSRQVVDHYTRDWVWEDWRPVYRTEQYWHYTYQTGRSLVRDLGLARSNAAVAQGQ